VYTTPVGTSAVLSLNAWPGTGTVSVFKVTGGARDLIATRPEGSTTVLLEGLPVGTHVYQAEYSGDEHTLPSTSETASVEVVVPPKASIASLPWVTTTDNVSISWTGSPGTIDIASFDVRYRRAAWNGSFGGWEPLLSRTSATSTTMTGKPGSTYCVSVRARDDYDTLSAWTAPTCTAVPLDDRSLAESGTWAKGTSTVYYRSTVKRASATGAKLTRTGVVAKRLAIVATTCSTCGTVKIYRGTTLLRTISLYSAATQHRRVLNVTTFTANRTGTIKVKVSSSGKAVRIDGLVVLRGE
jgi:hypothetical protein